MRSNDLKQIGQDFLATLEKRNESLSEELYCNWRYSDTYSAPLCFLTDRSSEGWTSHYPCQKIQQVLLSF